MINAGKLLVCVLLMSALSLSAQESTDLGSLSVDELMNVEVTSVSRKAQKLVDTAAAVFVITQDDIRRSGSTSIPEILRIVPGLEVARINGNVWAISARGFNGQFANKLLVLIDGRSLYTHLLSGVHWDVLDTMLEDIERIEVIRGPGGTLWGANAVNGIINIITKHSIDTQGSLLSAAGSSARESSSAGRYGGSIGNNGHYRVYGKWLDRPATIGSGALTHDALNVGRAGFRADWVSRNGDNFTFQGDAYRGDAETVGILVDPAHPFGDRVESTDVSGENLLFRWTSVQSPRSDTTFQVLYDHTARRDPSLVGERHMFDADFQQRFKAGKRNDLVWGAELRTTTSRADGPGLRLVRDSDVSSVVSAFIQDEIELSRRLRVTLGTKLQYDRVSKLQLQPTLRLLFRADPRHTIWAAATSAVRTMSEVELYSEGIVGAYPDSAGNAATFLVLSGDRGLKPERVESYEIGYRWQVTPDVTLDATAFHNTMRDLVGTRADQPFADPSGRTIIPVTFANTSHGRAEGVEFLVTDAVTPDWNITLGYSFFEQNATADGGLGSALDFGESGAPRHQVQMRSFLELPKHVELDLSAYYVGAFGTSVSDYLRLDAQISWRPVRQITLAINGQNLLQSSHSEFASALATPIQRTVNGKVTWRF
ncbi:MAG TPA: TonB-dependent receptor [Thermoanaerobaculia bacterium]